MPKKICLNPKLDGFDEAIREQKNRYKRASEIESLASLQARMQQSNTAQETKKILRDWVNYKADHSAPLIDMWDKWLMDHLNLEEVNLYYEELIKQTNLASFDEEMQMNPDVREIFLIGLAREETAFGAIKIASDYAEKYLEDGKRHLLRSDKSESARASTSWGDGFRYDQSFYGKDLVTIVKKDEVSMNEGVFTPSDGDSDSIIASTVYHEYRHEMLNAVTWLLLDKLKLLPAEVEDVEKKREIEALFLAMGSFVKRLCRRMLKTEGGTTGKAVNRIETDNTVEDGISEYGSTTPSEFHSESGANWRSTAPESPRRTKLGDAAENLYQVGLSGVVDQLYDIMKNNPDLRWGSPEINTDVFLNSEEYTDKEKETLKERMGDNYEKMSSTLENAMLARYRRIQNNKLTKTEIKEGRRAADDACKVILDLKERHKDTYNRLWLSEFKLVQLNRYHRLRGNHVSQMEDAMDNMVNRVDKINQIIKIIFDHSQCDKMEKISDVLLRAGWTESQIRDKKIALEKLCKETEQDDILVPLCEIMREQTQRVIFKVKKMNRSLNNAQKQDASSDQQDLLGYKAAALFSEQEAECTLEEKIELRRWMPNAWFDSPRYFALLKCLKQINDNANLGDKEKEQQKGYLLMADRFFAQNEGDSDLSTRLYNAEIEHFQKKHVFPKAKTAEESAKIFKAMKKGMIVATENTLNKISVIHQILDCIDSASRFITKQETENTFNKIEKILSQAGLTQAQINKIITNIKENWMKEIRKKAIQNTIAKIEKRKGMYLGQIEKINKGEVKDQKDKYDKIVKTLVGFENALRNGHDVDEKELKNYSMSYSGCFLMKKGDANKEKLSDLLFKQMIALIEQKENPCETFKHSTKDASTIGKPPAQEKVEKSCQLMVWSHFQSGSFDHSQIAKKNTTGDGTRRFASHGGDDLPDKATPRDSLYTSCLRK